MSYTMISAIFHFLGIILAKHVSLVNIAVFSICGIIIALTRKKKNSLLMLALFMFAVGGVSYNTASYNKLYNSFPDKYVTVTGTITSVPMSTSGEYKYKYVLDPDEVSYLGITEKTDTLLYIRTKTPYQFGDIVKLSGFLYEISGGNNQYDFDYSLSVNSKGIYNQITAFEISKIGTANLKNPKYWLGKLRSSVYNAINSKYEGETAALYTAILLGDKSHLSDAFSVKLLQTGVWQAIYSPYMHIILLTLAAGLFGLGGKRNTTLLVLLVLYSLCNTGNPNSIKSALLIASVTVCQRTLGYSNKMQQLSALVLIMTIINPMLCFSRGFVLSVASTLLLFFFYPTVYTLVSGVLLKRNRQLSKPASVISICITLPVSTFPLAVWLFGGVAIYSTIITTLLVPVILAIIVSSAVYMPALLLSADWIAMEKFIGKLLRFIEKLPDFIEKIPFHYISARTPTIAEIITAYLALWLIAQLVSRRKHDDVFKAVSAVTLSFIVSNTLFSQNPGLEIYFVNVGQGDSAVLHTSDETVLIDGGGAAEYSDSDYNVGDKVLVPYLISHGLADIDYAIVTHFHKDHAEGVVSAVKNLRVRNLVMPDSKADSSTEIDYKRELEQLAKEKNINIIYAEKDGMISLKSRLRLSFLAPDKNQMQSPELNDTSIVINAEYYEFSGLFTGDSTDPVDDSYPQNIDILKVAHHGSDSGSKKDEIDRLHPKYAVISVGKDNSYALPDETVIENLENVGAEILRTDRLGDIRFKIRKNGKISYKSLRKE